jgi:hypothetical protein
MNHRREGGRRSWGKHGAEVCPLCRGTGLITSNAWEEKARKGGIRSFLVSLQHGQLSMSQRGACGGRPRTLKIEDMERRKPHRALLHRCSGLPRHIITQCKNETPDTGLRSELE